MPPRPLPAPVQPSHSPHTAAPNRPRPLQQPKAPSVVETVSQLRPAPLRLVVPQRAAAAQSKTLRRAVGARPNSVRGTSDYLTARAANPYTGVVSPSVFGDDEERKVPPSPDGVRATPLPLFHAERRKVPPAEGLQRDRTKEIVPDSVPVHTSPSLARSKVSGCIPRTVVQPEAQRNVSAPNEPLAMPLILPAPLYVSQSAPSSPLPQREGQVAGSVGIPVKKTPRTLDDALELKYPDLSPTKERSNAMLVPAPSLEMRKQLQQRQGEGEKNPNLRRFLGAAQNQSNDDKTQDPENSGRAKTNAVEALKEKSSQPTQSSLGSENSASPQTIQSANMSAHKMGKGVGTITRETRRAQGMLADWAGRESQNNFDGHPHANGETLGRRTSLRKKVVTAAALLTGSKLDGTVMSPQPQSFSSPFSNYNRTATENIPPRIHRSPSTLERSWSVIGRSWSAIAQQTRLAAADLRRLPSIRLVPPNLAGVPKSQRLEQSPISPRGFSNLRSENFWKLGVEQSPAVALASLDIVFYKMVASAVSSVTSLLLGNKFLKTLLDKSTPPEVRLKQIGFLLSIFGRAAVFLMALLCIWHAFNALFELFRFLLTPFRIIFGPLRLLIRS